ncbi:conserved hypothetical protein [Flavobacterium sp. 9AF]|uniref:hypothetical protein n=1 Tax=Flavobacterium sp. 9AF TaxID=2653142 RepID=UPI0012F10402|nr:hypothetical protein [Flavobacterium sp. 9AF]VXA95765.1 conserved hypothetical protein [Flavobacterium sp. 9AF]
MKTISIINENITITKLTGILFFLFASLFALKSNAQVSVSVSINANTNRAYAPEYRHVHTSRCNHYEAVEYYYYPEIEAYFDINSAVYIYYTSNGWVRSRYLPNYCDHYDVRRGYRVALDYHGHRPYNHFNDHKRIYKAKKYYASHHHDNGKHKGHKRH